MTMELASAVMWHSTICTTWYTTTYEYIQTGFNIHSLYQQPVQSDREAFPNKDHSALSVHPHLKSWSSIR